MQTINKTTAKELIKDSKGLIFSTTFTKKDGSHRLMNARLGKKYTPTGKKQPYKPSDYNMIAVYDMKKKAFRMISFNTLTNLSINANKYIIK
tara:strand:+ start:176 stop:451 length:276 start_codon:yes stop_codon:yes gene_type:complete